MNAERMFFDANVLVYAHDLSADAKRVRAMEIVQSGWQSELPPNISVQVLQETHVTLIRKGLTVREAAATVRDFLPWNVVENRRSLFCEALGLQEEFQISFWDASILAAALASGAEELWSEDFQDGRVYRGLKVVNPFLGL